MAGEGMRGGWLDKAREVLDIEARGLAAVRDRLDGSFVRSITEDLRLRAIVRRSIELAHDLGIAVVAECIEDERQLEVLRALGCDFGQGYLFARAMDRDAAQQWLRGESPSRQAAH